MNRITEAEFAIKSPRFAIGQKFIDRGPTGKHPRECTVTDILTTTNSKGDVVRIRYVATHTFLGGLVTNHDVLETTIARNISD